MTNSNISEEDFDNAEDFGSFLRNFYTLQDSGRGVKLDLPTAVHVNADWNINNAFYINLNTDVSLISKSRKTANYIWNTVSLTPRYESKWFGFYLPFSVIEKSGFRIGAGLRAGPLYIGSGSVISAVLSDNNKEADVYAGLKISLFKNEAKDKDGDGVIDKDDECPKTLGPVENKGCPWGDQDGDGVLDNEDECPSEVGPVENNGCPWKDTDGDGVLDKDDKCKYDAGTVANMGCPEVEITEEVQKALNDFAKVILFNHGKSEIKEESHEVLNEIVKILNAYPSAKFSIEGHTDSIGSYAFNQKLSEERAQSVLDFLVENGVDASRLKAVGYGERRPIATNMYKPGRAQNRRVEINLVK
ncbi:OmpA family protein [Tamlana fucoidanivorans]|uniref:OmpA family protein n=2 Tax=Allotamlana fucoidanivorans TaxID=2583814 RepID=A0A5C4SQQ8_9FLAO|nr:OmpA family protein [Tamlana fucoidanivorans]